MRVNRRLVLPLVALLAVALGATTAASQASGKHRTKTKKIVMIIPIPCAAGPYFSAICKAGQAQAKATPGVDFELKTLTTPDNQAYINLLQTTEAAAHPAGYILMPDS